MKPIHETPYRILVVDDDQKDRHQLMEIIISSGWMLKFISSGSNLLDELIGFTPDTILLDIDLPNPNGIEICRSLKFSKIPRIQDIAIIMTTSTDSQQSRRESFAAGCHDYMVKPWNIDELVSKINLHIQNRRLRLQLEYANRAFQQQILVGEQKLVEAERGIIHALAKLAESRDDDTGHHIERVQNYVHILANTLLKMKVFPIDHDWVECVIQASCLHDIGKVSIPDAILRKPGKHTEEERVIMKSHSEIGFQTLDSIHCEIPSNQFLAIGKAIARSHHEKWDGTGYPQGLKKIEIPLEARLMTIVDVYDALRSVRCYKKAFSHEQAIDIMKEMAPTYFDPIIFEVFFSKQEEFAKAFSDAEIQGGIRDSM